MTHKKRIRKLLGTFILIALTMNDLNAQFQKHIPLINLTTGRAKSLSLNYDGSYFMSGYGLYQYSYDPYLIKTDKAGKAIWLRHYEIQGGPVKDGGFMDATIMYNDPNLIAATGYQTLPNINKQRMSVSQIDGVTGSAIRNISIFPFTNEWIGTANKVISSDDVLAVFGLIKRQNEDYKIAISTFDPFLNQLNAALFSFHNSNDQIPLDAIKVDDGYLIIGGSNSIGNYYISAYHYSSELFILKVDNNLNFQWNKTIQLKNQHIRGSGITSNEKKNEVYIAGDFKESGSTYATPFLLKLDLNGKVNWMKYYKGPKVLSSRFNSVSYNTELNEVKIATDFVYSPNGGTIFPSGYVKVDTEGKVQKTEYFEFLQYLGSGKYTVYQPLYAEQVINNHNNGFSLVANNSYHNQSTVNPLAQHGAVLIETLKDGSSYDVCTVPFEFEELKLEFSESKLKFKNSLPLGVHRFQYQYFNEKVFSLDCDEKFENKTSQGGKTQIFPNPSSDAFSILSTKRVEKIVVYDDRTARIKFENYRSEERIDIRSLEPGFYYVEISYTDGGTEVLTLVKN